MKKSIIVNNQFFSHAKALRSFFDAQFENPYSDSSGRFIWDFWSVPDQYRLLRTPAYHFFPKSIYEKFHNQLVWWGRQNLGCHNISPPWLSCYVDGCFQNLHTDVPHGPWAFVYSLTPWQARQFLGGETLVLNEDVLDYWKQNKTRKGLEHRQLLRHVEPKFNRLLVFDPRLPHGVKQVEKAKSVCDGRLVIHGWFVQPRPFIQGPLKEKSLLDFIEWIISDLASKNFLSTTLTGIVSLQLKISPSGQMRAVKVLSETLRQWDDERGPTRVISHLKKQALAYRFPKHGATSLITLPVIFENE